MIRNEDSYSRKKKVITPSRKKRHSLKKKVPNTLVIASITSFWSRRSFFRYLNVSTLPFQQHLDIERKEKTFFTLSFSVFFFNFKKKEKGFITSYYLHIFEWMSQNIVITMEIKWQNYCVNEAMWQQRFFPLLKSNIPARKLSTLAA